MTRNDIGQQQRAPYALPRAGDAGRSVINRMQTAATLLIPSCCIALAGCVSSKSPAPIVVVSPAPTRPHLILTADRASLHHGESVRVIATFVNPTKHRVALPTTSQVDDEEPSIEHRLQIDWKGENGSSSSGLSALGINTCPPSIEYLEPKTSRSYELHWKFDDRGKGMATLTYHFGYGEDFPPATFTIPTR